MEEVTLNKTETKGLLDILQDKITRLHEAAEGVERTLGPISLGMQQRTLMDNVKLYAMIDYLLDVAKELSRMANVEEPVVADRIIKRMTAEDMEVVEFNGHKYAPSTKTFVSVSQNNKPTVINWLKGHPLGKELVKEDVHAKTFESFIKKRVEQGEPIPEEVKVFDIPTLEVRKVRGK